MFRFTLLYLTLLLGSPLNAIQTSGYKTAPKEMKDLLDAPHFLALL